MANTRDFTGKNRRFTGTKSIVTPKGTTGQRNPTESGELRFNTSTAQMEYYNGTNWIAILAAPTVSSVSPTVITNSATNITITGTNFDATTVAYVVRSGVTTVANSTTYVSATELTANFTLSTDGSYFVQVVAGTGLAGTSATALLNVSDAPAFSTASGNVADVFIASPVSTSISATSDSPVTYSETTSVLTDVAQLGLSLNTSTGAISGTSPSPVGTSTTYSFTIRATDSESQIADRAFNIIVRRFSGGAFSASYIDELAQGILTGSDTTVTTGGTFTLNGSNIGTYEYFKTSGATTISSFSAGTYFSNNRDNYGSFCVFNGDLTINNGIEFIPPVRKLYTVMYVNGNLTLNGSISMKSRGANHNGSGDSAGGVTSANLPMVAGTYSAVTNPTIPSSGGGGGGASSGGGTATRGSGGGGGGGSNPQPGGSGSTGTAFTGGVGGGGGDNGGGSGGEGNGGGGGPGGGQNSSGGAGNPGGINRGSGHVGPQGTGGTLIVMCTGTFSGSGSLVANPYDGHGSGGHRGGGGTGGGIVQVFCNTNSFSGSTNVSGGEGGRAAGATGANGGAGAANTYTGYTG
jgi:hypothetical protein